MGRSLLRERSSSRVRPIGRCPECGLPIEASEGWLDAERVVAEHVRACAMSQSVRVMRHDPSRLRGLLRPAL